MGAWCLAAHVVGVSFMCGLGWFVQVVHYPLFTFATGPRWTEFHASHSQRTGWVVGVPWALQGFGALALLVWRPRDLGLGLVLVATALAGVTVAATVALALPAHARLARGFDATVHHRLLLGDRVRVAAWTAGALVAMAMVVSVA
ncbi:MAG: hypothetical protein FGM58_05725 [Acidimicrobiia bacterium]|nr:hypothetical protein [Acidimicrobiia bacterium]